MFRTSLWALMIALILGIGTGTSRAHSVPGPESDRHNTVYSYNISEVALDEQHKQLHVTMTVHMCPFCSPFNNYVKVTIEGLGTKYVYNTPVGTTYTYTFTFDASNLKVGDIVKIYSDVWCEWCGHWYDSKQFKVEQKIIDTPGLGSKCSMTLVPIGSSVNVGNGNLFDSHQVSPDVKMPLPISYNSRSSQNSRFGHGWNDSADIRLVRKSNGSIMLIDSDGREEEFIQKSDGTFASPAGNHDTLKSNKVVIFSDDMEKGNGPWIADSPWARVTTAYHSPNTSWTDSPNGNYANSIHKAITLPLNLSNAGKTKVTFWHKFALETGYDYGYIEISKDGGLNWTLLKSYNGFQNAWAQQTVGLDSFAGMSNLLLRFRLITDSSVVYDGWYIDDVEIASESGYMLQRKGGETVYFNQNGRPSRIEDRNGNITTYTYSGNNLSMITAPNGYTLYFSHDGSGHVTGISDSAGRSYTFGYDASGNLTEITNPASDAWSFSYDANHNLTEKTDPMGNTTKYAYDGQDRLISATDADGNSRSLTYGSQGVPAFSDPAGNVTEFTYNRNLNVTKKVDAQGNVTEYGWDADMNRTSVKDTSGTVSYTYDSAGNMLSTKDQMGNTTSYTYDSLGNVLAITDADGKLTSNAYDSKGNLISTTDPTGAKTSYEYDSRGNVAKITNAADQTTTFIYDQNNNLISTTNSAGSTTSFTYDAAGNLTSQTDASGNTTRFEYNSLNQLIKVTDPNGGVTTFTYDKNGNRASQTDANGNTTYYEYNSKGQLIKVKDALGNITIYAYGNSGCPSCSGGADKLVSVTDANGNSTTYQYDSIGRLVSEIDPLGNSTTYTYDAKGNLTSKTYADGATINYTYDALGRLLNKNYPDDTTETYTYDAKGSILTATNANISYTFTHDSGGKVTSVTDSSGRTISYQYYILGNKTKLAYPEGSVVSYSYDKAGRLSSIMNGGGKTYSFSYDNLGRRATLAYPNGDKTGYGYDSAGRLTSLIHKNSAGAVIASNTYANDNVGNSLSNATQDRTVTYQYDPIYRLTEALSTIPGYSSNTSGKGSGIPTATQQQKEFFTYDPVGNRLTSDKHNTYTYNQANQLMANGGQYTYDKNGNLTSKIEGTTIFSYYYDYENRLVKVVKAENGSPTTSEFKYDPFGRRIEKKVTESGTITVTRVVYDNEDIILEYDGNGNIGNRYIHGPGIDEPLAVINGKNTYYYHADGLGSIVALTDSSGKVLQTYAYDSFGNLKDQKNKVKQPYTFTGREWDKETGLYHNRARYYDPMVGRFISKDPIGFEGGDINLYSYVKNNPITGIDPSGLELISLQEGMRIVQKATGWLGVPYRTGGSSRSGIDCSHLVYVVCGEAGFSYPYVTTGGFPPADKFKKVTSPQEGDVVLFSGHMGVYTGGQVISAQSGAGKVLTGDMSWFGAVKGYYRYDKCNQ